MKDNMMAVESKAKLDTINQLVQVYSPDDPYKIIEKHHGPIVAEYRKKWHLADQERVKLDFPLHLNIEVVPGCNLKCEFCFYSGETAQQDHRRGFGHRISFDTFKRLVDEGADKGLYSIAMNGNNEPLLQQDIDTYIRYAREKGIVDLSLHSNAMLLDENMSQKLLDCGLSIIMFSIDAFSSDTYSKTRKGGDYDTVVANIERFIEMKKAKGCELPLVRVSFVENKLNTGEKNPFIEYWQDKADYILVQSFHNPLVGKTGYQRIEKDFRLEDTPFENCSQPWQRLFIASDGTVLPCCAYFGINLTVGNIYKQSLSEIWHSPAMEKMRESVNDKDLYPLPCKKCRQSVTSQKLFEL